MRAAFFTLVIDCGMTDSGALVRITPQITCV
jgi:hypothetical protein